MQSTKDTITQAQFSRYTVKYYDDFCSIFNVPDHSCSLRCTKEQMDRVEEWFNDTKLYISLLIGMPLMDIEFQPYQKGVNNKENNLKMVHTYVICYTALLRVASTLSRKVPDKYFKTLFIIPEEEEDRPKDEQNHC